MNRFFFDAYPTFALGACEVHPQADEGWGKRDLPDMPGDPAFSWHLARSLVEDEFDPTICQEMSVDHGVMSFMPMLTDTHWPVPIVPLAVNVIQHPVPTARRLYKLGAALRRAIESYPQDIRVVVMGTGGLSHQFGHALRVCEQEWDNESSRSVGNRSRATGCAIAPRLHGARRHRGHRDDQLAPDAIRARSDGYAGAADLPCADDHRIWTVGAGAWLGASSQACVVVVSRTWSFPNLGRHPRKRGDETVNIASAWVPAFAGIFPGYNDGYAGTAVRGRRPIRTGRAFSIRCATSTIWIDGELVTDAPTDRRLAAAAHGMAELYDSRSALMGG
jgi:hypothetical protein